MRVVALDGRRHRLPAVQCCLVVAVPALAAASLARSHEDRPAFDLTRFLPADDAVGPDSLDTWVSEHRLEAVHIALQALVRPDSLQPEAERLLGRTAEVLESQFSCKWLGEAISGRTARNPDDGTARTLSWLDERLPPWGEAAFSPLSLDPLSHDEMEMRLDAVESREHAAVAAYLRLRYGASLLELARRADEAEPWLARATRMLDDARRVVDVVGDPWLASRCDLLALEVETTPRRDVAALLGLERLRKDASRTNDRALAVDLELRRAESAIRTGVVDFAVRWRDDARAIGDIVGPARAGLLLRGFILDLRIDEGLDALSAMAARAAAPMPPEFTGTSLERAWLAVQRGAKAQVALARHRPGSALAILGDEGEGPEWNEQLWAPQLADLHDAALALRIRALRGTGADEEAIRLVEGLVDRMEGGRIGVHAHVDAEWLCERGRADLAEKITGVLFDRALRGSDPEAFLFWAHEAGRYHLYDFTQMRSEETLANLLKLYDLLASRIDAIGLFGGGEVGPRVLRDRLRRVHEFGLDVCAAALSGGTALPEVAARLTSVSDRICHDSLLIDRFARDVAEADPIDVDAERARTLIDTASRDEYSQEQLARFETFIGEAFARIARRDSPLLGHRKDTLDDALEHAVAPGEHVVHLIPTPRRFYVVHRGPDGASRLFAEACDEATLVGRLERLEGLWQRDLSREGPLPDTVEAWIDVSRSVMPDGVRERLRLGDAILVVAPSFLSQLPYEALLTVRPATDTIGWASLPYLLRDHVVRQAPSLAYLGQSWRERGARPVPPAEPGLGLLAIDSTAVEPLATHLARAWGESQIVREPGVVGSCLHEQSRRGGARSVVIVAHGAGNRRLSADDAGLRPVLSVDDIRAARCRADLVILAACSGSEGRAGAGEFPRGIARELLEHGASSVIASRRDIPAEETCTILLDFIARGGPTAVALADAKRAYLRAAAERHWTEGMPHPGHPRFWAGLVLTGLDIEAGSP